jgi:hypothetical protein
MCVRGRHIGGYVGMGIGGCSKMDLGTKMGPGRTKNQSAQNGFKTYVCIGLVDMNLMQLEWAQTNIVCERYHILFVFPNR